jgi:hypothetical protein
MHTTRCEGCGQSTPVHDITHFGSGEGGYRELCSLCFNADVARRWGNEDFENIRLESIAITDGAGQTHQFHFRTHLLGAMVTLDAFELQQGVPAGYQFQLIGDPHDDLFVLLGRMIGKIRRALATTHIEEDAHGLHIKDLLVRGSIDSDPDADERTPLLTIDGRQITWDEFGHMMMTFEGWQFKLELFDRSDEP